MLRSDYVATALHVGLALLWIPTAGAVGAARANVVGRLAAVTVAAVLTGRLLGRPPFSRRAGFVVVAAGAMAAVVYLLPVESVVLRLTAGSLVYVATLASLGGVTVGELRELARRVRSGA